MLSAYSDRAFTEFTLFATLFIVYKILSPYKMSSALKTNPLPPSAKPLCHDLQRQNEDSLPRKQDIEIEMDVPHLI